jgi:hypothetical protein
MNISGLLLLQLAPILKWTSLLLKVVTTTVGLGGFVSDIPGVTDSVAGGVFGLLSGALDDYDIAKKFKEAGDKTEQLCEQLERSSDSAAMAATAQGRLTDLFGPAYEAFKQLLQSGKDSNDWRRCGLERVVTRDGNVSWLCCEHARLAALECAVTRAGSTLSAASVSSAAFAAFSSEVIHSISPMSSARSVSAEQISFIVEGFTAHLVS